MDMFTLTTKILAVQRVAERHGGCIFDARSAKQIIHDTSWLLACIAKGDLRERIAERVRWMRVAENWPGGMAGWRWFDDRLAVLAEYLEQDETFPSQAELVEELERACRAGVIR
jgi:hypothetical protein